METAAHSTIKTRHQMARAHKLVDIIDTHTAHLGDDRNRIAVTFAENLPVAKWADVAFLAGITNPSVTTVTMAIAILEARVTDDEIRADKAAFDCFAGMDAR